MRNRRDNGLSGFTIVELLVVVVIIGILASISYISYMGISQKATVAVLKSDLRNATTTLELDKTVTGNYPANQNDANGGKGLPKSPGTSYQYTVVGNDYNLSATSGLLAFYTSSTLGGTIADGVWSGHTAPGDPVWKQIGLFNQHACAIISSGQTYCWGRNTSGQLGNNSQIDSSLPVAVSMIGALTGKTMKSIKPGISHTCGISSDDLAYCWGYGQYVVNSPGGSLVPVSVDVSGNLAGKTIKSISSSDYYICVVASDDRAYCWGDGPDGQLGNIYTNTNSGALPVDTSGVMSGKTIVSITAGQSHTCALDSNGLAYCWGNNGYGQLGDGTTTNRPLPVAVSMTGGLAGKTIKAIAASSHKTCAIASDNLEYCWGDNTFGMLGDNTGTNRSVPTAVYTGGALSGKTIKMIAPGTQHSCAIASDDKAYCWGFGGMGALGDAIGSTTSEAVAVSTSGVLSGKTIKSIVSGTSSSCVVASDNQVYCWGWNTYGQLGDGTTNNSNAPVRVLSLP